MLDVTDQNDQMRNEKVGTFLTSSFQSHYYNATWLLLVTATDCSGWWCIWEFDKQPSLYNRGTYA